MQDNKAAPWHALPNITTGQCCLTETTCDLQIPSTQYTYFGKAIWLYGTHRLPWHHGQNVMVGSSMTTPNKASITRFSEKWNVHPGLTVRGDRLPPRGCAGAAGALG